MNRSFAGLALRNALVAVSDPTSVSPMLLLIARHQVEAAARRWLDLQPEECGTCIATPGTVDVEAGFADCLTCKGSGRVYKTETVERIANAIRDGLYEDWVAEDLAVAVLDVLNEADPPKETE